MPRTKIKTGKDKRHDKIKISDLSDKLIRSIQEITLASDKDSIDLINSAIASREVTNDIDDLENWCDNHLAKKTIIVSETDEEYFDIVHSALLSLPTQFSMGIGNQKRGPIKMIGDKVGGYSVEFAVKKLARIIGVEIGLAHQIGEVAQFINSDFPSVFEGGKWRKSKINVGAKSGKKNSLWMDVPTSQFQNTDYQIFGRCVTNGDHLENCAMMDLLNNPNLRNRHYPESFLKYKKGLARKPMSVYLVGFAAKPISKSFTYKGYKARKIFHITEMAGVIPSDYEDVVRKKENLPANFKIEILCIERFQKHKGSFCAWNSGSIIKTREQIDELIRKL